MATDEATLAAINDLADQEHQLLNKESRQSASDADRQRLAELKVELDRNWDLLRQRRALRSAGQNPDDAVMRSESIVENYRQ